MGSTVDDIVRFVPFYVKLLCIICIQIRTVSTQEGIILKFKVPEGIYSYPKPIGKIVTTHAFSSCRADSAHFASPNGLRTHNRPLLFGVRAPPAPVLTTTPSKQHSTPEPNTTNSKTKHVLSTATNALPVTSLIYNVIDSSSTTSDTSDRPKVRRDEPSTWAEDKAAATSFVTSSSGNQTVTASVPTQMYNVTREEVSPIATDIEKIISIHAPNSSTETVTPSSQTVTRTVQTVTPSSLAATPSAITPVQDNITSGSNTTGQVSTYGSTTAPPIQSYLELVQLYDLDREKEDRHFVTVQCFEKSFGNYFPVSLVLIEVEDINDHTPVFEPASLRSMVPYNLNYGDTLLHLKATDGDEGLNAELHFDGSKGTERIKYPNGTEVYLLQPTVAVLSSGFVIASSFQMPPNVDFIFEVIVKDRGKLSNGNRATATATVSVFETLPTPTPTPSSTPNSTSPSPPNPGGNHWYIGVAISAAVVIALLLIAMLCYRRKKMQTHSPVLVIDDSNLDGFEELTNRRDLQNIGRDNRHDADYNENRTRSDNDNEALLDISDSQERFS